METKSQLVTKDVSVSYEVANIVVYVDDKDQPVSTSTIYKNQIAPSQGVPAQPNASPAPAAQPIPAQVNSKSSAQSYPAADSDSVFRGSADPDRGTTDTGGGFGVGVSKYLSMILSSFAETERCSQQFV